MAGLSISLDLVPEHARGAHEAKVDHFDPLLPWCHLQLFNAYIRRAVFRISPGSVTSVGFPIASALLIIINASVHGTTRPKNQKPHESRE